MEKQALQVLKTKRLLKSNKEKFKKFIQYFFIHIFNPSH